MGMIKIPQASEEFFANKYQKIFESGLLAEGDWNKNLEKWTEQYTSAKFATACNSNGAGILAILNILRQKYGKTNIFIQSNTMYGVKTTAITSGLKYVGAVNCKLDYLMPSLEQLQNFAIGLKEPENSIFLLTHIGGWINPEIESIAAYCCEKGITLIEDCAHSLGSTLNGKHSGLYGFAGVYSLYATKAIPAGEGGLIVTNNEKLDEEIKKYSIYDRFDQKLDLGVNIRMSEISALLSYSVCKEIDQIIANKYHIAEKYIVTCKENNWEFIHPTKNGQQANLYKFILKTSKIDPGQVFNKIKTRTSPVYDYHLGADPEEVSNRHICLPIWYDLEDEIVDKVIAELEQ